MAKAKKAAAQPIIDVLHPNDSPPEENSRSVIITKRPLMRDPMMAAPAGDDAQTDNDTKTEAVAEPAKPAPLTVSHQLVITPPSSTEPTQPAVVEAVAAGKPIVDVVHPNEIPAATAESEPEIATTDSIGTSTDVKTDPLNLDAAEAQAEDEEEKRQAAIAALVDSQQYFLPVDGVELKRARYFVALGALLIVGLGLIWADLTLDAGLLSVEGVPHTTFFQQVSVAETPPLAPPTTQTYTAPFSKYTFKLPAAWKLDESRATPVQDNLSTGPTSTKPSIGTTKILFASGPTLMTTDVAATVDTVRYQKLGHTKGATTYLQELVYHTDASHFNVVANLVNDNNVKPGDALRDLTPTFHTINSSSASQLGAFTIHPNDFPSLKGAQKYTQLSAYQQARIALLSLTSPTKQ